MPAWWGPLERDRAASEFCWRACKCLSREPLVAVAVAAAVRPLGLRACKRAEPAAPSRANERPMNWRRSSGLMRVQRSGSEGIGGGHSCLQRPGHRFERLQRRAERAVEQLALAQAELSWAASARRGRAGSHASAPAEASQGEFDGLARPFPPVEQRLNVASTSRVAVSPAAVASTPSSLHGTSAPLSRSRCRVLEDLVRPRRVFERCDLHARQSLMQVPHVVFELSRRR